MGMTTKTEETSNHQRQATEALNTLFCAVMNIGDTADKELGRIRNRAAWQRLRNCEKEIDRAVGTLADPYGIPMADVVYADTAWRAHEPA